MKLTYKEQLQKLKDTITEKFPNTEWEFDSESSILIERTNYFNRYVERIQKYTSYSPEPFLRHLLRRELELEDIVVIGEGIDGFFGLTID